MYNTLIELIQLRSTTSDSGITFIESGSQENYLSYRELYDCSLIVLGHLQTQGISAGEELVFQIEDNRTFITLFWACLLGGIIPVPLTIGNTDDHKQKLFNIWKVLDNPYLVTSKKQCQRIQHFLVQNGQEDFSNRISSYFVDIENIYVNPQNGNILGAKENSLAFIQFSSGSTGIPKGVKLTHKNLLINMAAISHGGQYTKDDSMLSWMPLTHDMGLIGFHLNPLCIGMNQYIIPTNLFVRRPSIWLDKASKHKVSVLCSPNFGYKYIIKHCADISQYDWDLSNVRILYNGAEPISEQLSAEFLDHLSTKGLKRTAMCPVYGLAEASLAVSMTALEEEVISCSLDRNRLNPGDNIVYGNNDDNAVSFVNVGRPINDCFVQITDDQDKKLADEVVGYVQISGDNVTIGYYNNSEATENAITGSRWLKTGDLGFMRDNCLYITGRAKDILFINGQNYYPHDLERVAEKVEGIELNKIAIVGCYNDAKDQEEVIAFVFHRGNLSNFLPVYTDLKSYLNRKVGLQIDRIIPTRDIPRTTSGKLQRFKLLQRFKQGIFNDIEKQLDEIVELQASVDIEMPSNEVQERLLDIWKKTLELESIGVNQRFYEIGGNSLKAAEISMAAIKEFNIEFKSDIFYTNPTIKELSIDMETWKERKYEPIVTVPVSKYYPLSSSQKRLFFAWKMNSDSLAYNLPVAFQLKGRVEVSKIESTIKRLIDRHDALRMVFEMFSEPKFSIKESLDFKMQLEDCEESNVSDRLKDCVKPFDLEGGPLLRSNILKIAQDNYILFVDFHHIISDGLSIYNFIREFLLLYSDAQLPKIEANYTDYTLWEKEILESNDTQTKEDFWLKQFNEELPLLDMPLDFPRPTIFSGNGRVIEFEIDKKLSYKLKTLADANKSTLHALMFTVYYVLLSKCTRQNKLIIGIPVAGRQHPDLRNSVGMFVNNLAVKCESKDDQSFSALLKLVQDHLLECFDNQNYPFDSLVDRLTPSGDSSRNPIFDTMFNYQNMGFPANSNHSFTINKYFFDPGFSKFDLSMEVYEEGEKLTYNIEYCTDIFEKNSILQFQKYFNNLLNSVVNHPNIRLGDLSVMSNLEYDSVVSGFNDTSFEYTKEKTIHQLFEEQARKTPSAIAIDSNGVLMTYQELDNQTNKLANVLRQEGVKPNDIVAVLLPRSTEFIMAILGVLKSGAAYLPIDIDLPKERINYILEHSKCKMLVDDHRHNDWFRSIENGPENTLNTVNIDLAFEVENDTIVDHKNVSSDLAYVIYTSGTTGKPKGVTIEHQSLVNYVCWSSYHYLEEGVGSFPFYTSVSFDLTITSIFIPLTTGNKIIVYPDNNQELLISQIIGDNKVDVIKLTPSHLRIINNHIRIPADCKVKTFIAGGEELDSKLANDICAKFDNDLQIFNEYGPTEATVGCMIYKFEAGATSSSVPIGIPANNTQIYVLDEFLKPVGTNIKGDLYISGDCLARGYLNDQKLTDNRFMANPFKKGAKIYKSGDLARRLPSGYLEFLGRSDQQVKINGYRIEILEIENNISDYPGVKQAIVSYNVDKNSLYAYYTNDSDIKHEDSVFRDFLAGRLPHYMIPLSFSWLKEIPLTSNGKVNYDLLPQPETTGIKKNVPPKNEIESISLKVWRDILGEEDLSVEDNFFELGGDSIKAVQISSQLAERGIETKPKDILTFHTIKQVSVHAKTVSENLYSQVAIEGYRFLTPIESWFFNQKFKNPNYYNQSVLLKFSQNINVRLIQGTLERLIEHHDGLRSNYIVPDKKVVFDREALRKPFQIKEFRVNSDLELVLVCQNLKDDFDISRGKLINAGILKTEANEDYLLLTCHHLVIDGVSWRVLLEDFYKCYQSLGRKEEVNLPKKTASLIDWSREINRYSQSQSYRNECKYWEHVESLNFALPQDYDTSEWTIENLRTSSRYLSKEDTDCLLKKAHEAYNTDIVTLLNTALVLTLKKWTGLGTFIIEQESHGRHLDNIDLSRTVGWFTSMYPVVLELKSELISDQIKEIKEQLKAVPSNGIGYGLRKYLMSTETNDSRNNVRFNYLGQFDSELNNELFSFMNRDMHGFESDPENHITTKLDINAMVLEGRLTFDIGYNKLAFKASTVIDLIDSFFEFLDKILHHLRGETDLHFTPSDFDSVDLDEEELDSLFN